MTVNFSKKLAPLGCIQHNCGFVRRLGEGSNGVVDLVEYKGRLSCLKIGKGGQDQIRSFMYEAFMMMVADGAGGTPRVIMVASDMPGLLMTYCPHPSLLQLLEEGSLVTVHQALGVFKALTMALSQLHGEGSRLLGYSMVSAVWGGWVYLIVGMHWLINTAWHLITVLRSEGPTAARPMSSLVMGGVWLICMTNEQGGRQLGRFIMYYGLAMAESAICGYLWHVGMAGSGDFFAGKAPWAMLIALLVGLVAHMLYYTICHPGSLSFTSRGLLCCSGNRWDPVDDDP